MANTQVNGWAFDPAEQAWTAAVGPGRVLIWRSELDEPPSMTPQQVLSS